ncbi:MAG: hypothetical protein K0S07_734 [Chlamydiales bacterium]|nr:hypothetical protein [Chlamydiales bacterium]
MNGKRLKSWISIIPLLLCLSFSYGEQAKKDGLIADVLDKSVSILKRKHQMQFLGKGVVEYDKLNSLSLNFCIDRELTTKEARVVLVKSAQHFLYVINTEKKLAPYLEKHPFTLKDISLSIAYKIKNNKDPDHSDIGVAFINRSKSLVYVTCEGKSGSALTIDKENFKEALKIVRERRSVIR